MNIKPQNNHQIRVITLEDGNFKDETLYQVKKGTCIGSYFLKFYFIIFILFYRMVFRISGWSNTFWI